MSSSRTSFDARDGDVVARVGDHQRGEHGLALVRVVVQDELGDDALDLLGGHHVPPHPADVGLGGLHVALHQLGLLGEDVGAVGEDVGQVRGDDLLGGRRRVLRGIVLRLVVVGKRDRAPVLGAIPLRHVIASVGIEWISGGAMHPAPPPLIE
jgi:hypothetical protein